MSARLLVRSPKRTLMVAALVGTGVGGLVAGPVAAVMAAGYGVLGVRAVLRRHLNGRAERARRRRWISSAHSPPICAPAYRYRWRRAAWRWPPIRSSDRRVPAPRRPGQRP
ncbi:hypothetical protein JNW88_19550 [Micromonospora sp. ATA32]|nr:hypothetical protein [Micromonospora sp. ATA32]